MASQLGRDLILDLCSGFWGVDLTTWSDDGLRSTGFEIESELFLKALLSGFSVAQIPIPYRARAKGAKLRTVHDGSRILLSILSSMRFRRGLGGGPRQSESSLIRSVLAVCFIQGSGRLLVLADSTRVKEAKLLTQRLNAGGIDAQVELLAPKAGADPKELMDSMVQRSSEQAPCRGPYGITRDDQIRLHPRSHDPEHSTGYRVGARRSDGTSGHGQEDHDGRRSLRGDHGRILSVSQHRQNAQFTRSGPSERLLMVPRFRTRSGSLGLIRSVYP